MLDTLQRWLQEVIVDPAPDDEVEARHRARAEQWVRPTDRLTAYERLAVYRDGYLMRMEEALEADFPALARFLGAHAFHHMVAAYVQAHPSRHYNLNRLSDRVPEFVAQWDGCRRPAFAADLARLELTVTHVFDLPSTPALSQADLDRVSPDRWDVACLRPVQALRLLAFDHDVDAYMQAVMDEAPLPSTARRSTWLVVHRRGFEMARQQLSRKQHEVLGALVGGASLYDAFILASRGRGRVDGATFAAWVSGWVRDGLFADIEVRATG